MVDKDSRWRRWAGQRADLVEAAELASDALRIWSGYPSDVRVTIKHRGGLTERHEPLAALEKLNARDLRRVKSISISVEPSRDAWLEEFERRIAAGEEDDLALPIRASVSIRAIRSDGVTLETNGPDRMSVMGLTEQLEGVLQRGAPRLQLDGFSIAIGAVVPLLITGVFFGQRIPQSVGWTSRNDVLELGEGVGVGVGIASALAIGAMLLIAFPNLEILDEGEVSRFRRLRRIFVAGVSSLLLGLVAAFLYDALK